MLDVDLNIKNKLNQFAIPDHIWVDYDQSELAEPGRRSWNNLLGAIYLDMLPRVRCYAAYWHGTELDLLVRGKSHIVRIVQIVPAEVMNMYEGTRWSCSKKKTCRQLVDIQQLTDEEFFNSLDPWYIDRENIDKTFDTFEHHREMIEAGVELWKILTDNNYERMFEEKNRPRQRILTTHLIRQWNEDFRRGEAERKRKQSFQRDRHLKSVLCMSQCHLQGRQEESVERLGATHTMRGCTTSVNSWNPFARSLDPIMSQLKSALWLTVAYLNRMSPHLAHLSFILFRSNKMRGALSLFLLCIALSQAIVYETSFDVIPTTGYFSPIYKADTPSVFNIKLDGYYGGSTFYSSFCDGRPVNELTTTCTTYQVVVGTYGAEVTPPDRIILSVFQSDVVEIIPGQQYTSPNDTLYRFSSDVPYIYTLTDLDAFPFIVTQVGFKDKLKLAANATLTTTGSVHPLYAATYPTTFGVQLGDMFGSTFIYEGVTYSAPDAICSSQDAVVLVDQSSSGILNFLPARTCGYFGETDAFNATVISAQTPATLNVSTSGDYTAPCQTYGNSSYYYALIKLVNTDVYSKGGIVNGLTVESQPGPFDAVINCGTDNTVIVPIQVNGPYTSIDFSVAPELINLLKNFYQIHVPAGIISGPFSNDPLKQYAGQSCSTETSFNYFGHINDGAFSLCYTVNEHSTFYVPANNSAFVLQPPEGYCIRSDGIPSNSSTSVSLYSDASMTFFYEDENTTLFTVTCSNDILYVQPMDLSPMTINFTLVPISGQGVYGQNYNVDSLLILQYPPLTASAGIFSVNVTGSVGTLRPIVNPRLSGKRAVSNPAMPTSNSLQTNTSPLSQFIVLVMGQGQMTTDLNTSDGLNVGYDTNYSLYPSTSSTSSTSSTFSTSSTDSSSSTSTTNSDESSSSVESTSSTSSEESSSSTSSEESSSSTSSEESSSSTSSEESSSSSSSEESSSSSSSEESSSSTSSEESSSSSSSALDSSSSTTSETSSASVEESTSTEESSTVSSTTSTSVQSPSSTTSSSVTSSTSSTSSALSTSSTSSSTSSVVTEENGTDSSSADVTTTTSASVSFTDTSVIPTDNVSNDSSMVKASVLSVVVMALFCLC
ncbi:hypothetical protein PROFUN_03119 [Planoprotostelium fungivorum]|uniref:Uncharacterized protein n=1 Tax=Planoprotostelium fungivorum TaxID=1890364 RepID=A0A2P6NQ97_9EUKA|nr:hypothetical protein PROFUN_03119 [Planoprotostelium fungivorum]